MSTLHRLAPGHVCREDGETWPCTTEQATRRRMRQRATQRPATGPIIEGSYLPPEILLGGAICDDPNCCNREPGDLR